MGSHALFVSFASGQDVFQASFLEQIHESRKRYDVFKLRDEKPLAGGQAHQVPFFQTLHLSMVDARLYLLLALLDQRSWSCKVAEIRLPFTTGIAAWSPSF